MTAFPGQALAGTVTAFDDRVGLGTITTRDGVDHRFHCVELADGTRTVGVGTAVTFRPLVKLGDVEAADIVVT